MTEHGNGQLLYTIVLADVYGQIERVLLREWCGCALAAVLLFLSQQPQYTYLTYVRDAPHHAAVALLRRQQGGHRAFDLLETENSAGKAPMATATRSVGAAWASRPMRPSLQASLSPQGLERNRTLGSPAFVAPVTHAEISLARWRAWMDETAAMANLDYYILFPPPATTLSADSPAPTEASAAVVSEHVRCTADLHSAAIGSVVDAAASCKVMQTRLRDGASPNEASKPSASALGVPLHLLATFIRRECRIGATHNGPSTNGTAPALARDESVVQTRCQPQQCISLAAPRSPFSSFLYSVSSLEVLAGENLQRSFTGNLAALAAAPPCPCRVRTAHLELLVLFLQVLRRKQSEAAARSGGAAAGETIEELTAAVLAERCDRGGRCGSGGGKEATSQR
ncbi:hypothetical_protein [Leishmania infantum]|uniref:Hypothetical_protein n=1 Tax=Leishmania infantum TaxID=5671 RepID=A0A6L0WRQ2_LEIIN|nr:hypothetical_protein [Leishmania infantum]SUZ40348.1 hypothetical_protein [Leishmania infantum]